MISNTIIYSNKLDETELLRSLSLKGIPSFNYKVFNFKDLLLEASLKLGKVKEGKLINKDIAITLIESFINNNDVYKFTSFNDVKHIYKTLNEVRKAIIEDNELGVFKNKVCDIDLTNKNIEILFYLYKTYLDKLKENNYYDEILLARSIIKEDKKIFDEIIVLSEEKLTPLEIKLLNVVSNYKVKHLSELYGVTYKENRRINNISNYFGEQTEVESTIANILNSNSHLDEVLILLADTNRYVHLLKELSEIYDIKMTFECGEPIYFTNPYKLYRSLNSIENDYFFDVQGYKKLFENDSFRLNDLIDVTYKNNTAELLGRLKISFDEDSNNKKINDFNSIEHKYKETFYDKIDFKNASKVFISEDNVYKVVSAFNLGKAFIIDKFSYIKDEENKKDEIAKDIIIDILNTSANLYNKDFRQSYLEQIDSLFINRKKFKSGAIHVASIDQGLSTIRKKVYILGLNANNFPGKPKEDYLMNDYDYKLLTNIERKSDTIINDKKDFLNNLISNYNQLGVEVNLSFNAKDIAEVKDINPSSVIYEYLTDNPDIKLKYDISQHDDDLSPLKKITSRFIHNEISYTSPIAPPLDKKNNNLLDKSFSPSKIEQFIECPLKFYLSSVLYADKKEDIDYLDNIPANSFGDVFHFAIESYVNNIKSIDSEEKFLKLAEDIYKAYEKLNVPFVKNESDFIRYKNACINTYRKLEFYRIKNSEFKIKKEDNVDLFGVKFVGSIDLVLEDIATNEIVIFDHKTGRKAKHASSENYFKDEIFYKDIQGIIYAYLYKKLNPDANVKKVIFYYNCLDEEYIYLDPLNEITTKKLEELLSSFKNALNNNKFITDPLIKINDNERCKYCDFSNICKRGI